MDIPRAQILQSILASLGSFFGSKGLVHRTGESPDSNFRASNMTVSQDELFHTFVVGSDGSEDIACVLSKKLPDFAKELFGFRHEG